MALYFSNPGEADLTALTTMGVNVKQDSKSAIGWFGTGFKYGVAGVLRLGGRVILYSGLTRYEFVSSTKDVRGRSFGIVTLLEPDRENEPCVARPLGFTTEIGKAWEPWMYYREFRCNALDEAGSLPTTRQIEPAAGTTLLIVECRDVEEAHYRASEYFLDTAVREELEEICVHDHPDKSQPGRQIFYRGIRVGQYKSPPLFVYDYRSLVRLTEDRTVLYPQEVERSLVRGLTRSRDARLVETILTAPEGTMEKGLDFGVMSSGSEVFLDVAESLLKKQPKDLNGSVRPLLVRTRNLDPYIWVDPNVVQAKQLMTAERFCLEMGYDTSDHSIRIVKNLGFGVLGRVHFNDIYLSETVFGMGTKMVAGTLLEEMIHIRHGLDDMTREMQNFLVDKVVSMYEERSGVPL